MSNIFALMGKKRLGKSPTIRTVVELLTAKYPDAKIEHNHTTKKDMRVVLTINGLKIGIESQDDPSSRVIKSLDLFGRVGCDVIICATRSKGATVDTVNSLPGFEVHWLTQPEKSQPNEQVLRSLAMAREIVERVEALVRSTKPAATRSLAATA